MKKTSRIIGIISIALGSALPGSTTYAQPSVSVGVSVPLPSVEIHVESDFYEPLTPHGEWVVIGTYGRCWRPARVEASWRPYCNGSWQRTEAGWYWVSDEPWAWATYHYGRWDFTTEYGWYWVPQVQWAPAWVSWHSGGGYVGWAPLQPAVIVSASGYVGFNVTLISPRAYVFVEQRRFLEPIRPTTVVVNNTTIISQTTVISNTKIVNNTVINEGPDTAVIEKASGHKVEAVPVKELRHKTEAAVVAKQKPSAATSEKKVKPSATTETETRGKKTEAAPAAPEVKKPAAAPPEPAAPDVKKHETPGEKHKPAPTAPELKPKAMPEAKPEARPETKPEVKRPAADKQPAAPKADKPIEKQEKPAQPADKKTPPTAKEKPAASEKKGADPADKDKDHGNKPNE